MPIETIGVYGQTPESIKYSADSINEDRKYSKKGEPVSIIFILYLLIKACLVKLN